MGCHALISHSSGAVSHPDWPHAETRGAGPIHMVPLAGSQHRGRCSCRACTKPYCRGPEGFPPRAQAHASPSTAGHMAQPGTSSSGHPAEDAPRAARVPSQAAPAPPALLGGLCHPPAGVLMVLCPALNYFAIATAMCWRAALAVTPPSLPPPPQPGELMAEAHHTWSLIIGFLP